MSDRLRIGAGLAVVAAAVVLFVVLSDGGGDSNRGASGTPARGKVGDRSKTRPASTPVIRLEGGEPIGGIPELEVTSGDRVRFRVSSDIGGEVHVHGYDYEKPVQAGGSVSFDFRANLEGGFEVELHHGGGENPIADLVVEPG